MSKRKARSKPVLTYYESNDSDDSQSNFDLLLTMRIKGMAKRNTHKKLKKSVPGPKKTPAKKSKTTPTQRRTKGRPRKAVSSTGVAERPVIDLEDFKSSDEDEVVNAAISESLQGRIKNQVDNFFKDLESDCEEDTTVTKPIIPPGKKDKQFYVILTDSEDEGGPNETISKNELVSDPEVVSTSCINESNFSSLPSTSGCGITNNSPEINSGVDSKDPLAYVDELLKEYNVVVDLTEEEKPKENVPESLEDLKKRTDELLGDIGAMLDKFKPKKAKEDEPKAAAACPICFEPLGGSVQAMSTTCGHIFCKPCLKTLLETTKKCPTCRKGINKAKIHPIYL